jgi:hypothetical protein
MKCNKTFIASYSVLLILMLSLLCFDGAGREPGLRTFISSDSLPHFLKLCDSWDLNATGFLMGIPRGRDSLGHLCFSACYSCQNTFDIIFVLKGGLSRRIKLGDESISKIFTSGCANTFQDFDCYAFVLKMKNPDKMADMHATRYSFPTAVTVYKRIQADNWSLVKKYLVKSYKEYRTLQFNTIYGLGM